MILPLLLVALGDDVSKLSPSERQRVVNATLFVESAFAGDIRRGTGVRFLDERHIITCSHVISGATTITIGKFIDNKEWRRPARRELDLPSIDLAVLVCEDAIPGDTLSVSSQIPIEGDTLWTFGYPLDIRKPDFTDVGVRSELRMLSECASSRALGGVTRFSKSLGALSVLNLEASVVHGHSGAPVVNGVGEIVGFVFGGEQDGTIRRAWAIPASAIEKLRKGSGTGDQETWPPGLEWRWASELESSLFSSSAVDAPRLRVLPVLDGEATDLNSIGFRVVNDWSSAEFVCTVTVKFVNDTTKNVEVDRVYACLVNPRESSVAHDPSLIQWLKRPEQKPRTTEEVRKMLDKGRHSAVLRYVGTRRTEPHVGRADSAPLEVKAGASLIATLEFTCAVRGADWLLDSIATYRELYVGIANGDGTSPAVGFSLDVSPNIPDLLLNRRRLALDTATRVVVFPWTEFGSLPSVDSWPVAPKAKDFSWESRLLDVLEIPTSLFSRNQKPVMLYVHEPVIALDLPGGHNITVSSIEFSIATDTMVETVPIKAIDVCTKERVENEPQRDVVHEIAWNGLPESIRIEWQATVMDQGSTTKTLIERRVGGVKRVEFPLPGLYKIPVTTGGDGFLSGAELAVKLRCTDKF